MTDSQIENLFLFYFLYNGAERTCDLPNQSPDYLLEKWNKLIGIEGDNQDYPELKESPLFQQWEKTWLKGQKNPIPDNIMMFVIKTHPQENEGKYCQFLKLCNLFKKYIGKTNEITQEEYNHIHPLFVRSIQNIIERGVRKEDLREILLDNMLS
jgi:hypothetical protein